MPIIIRQVESKGAGRKAISMDQGMPKLPLQMYKDMSTNEKISQINSNNLKLWYKVTSPLTALGPLELLVALSHLPTILGVIVNSRGHQSWFLSSVLNILFPHYP